MKKGILWVMASVMFAFGLAACGSSGGSSAPAPTNNTPVNSTNWNSPHGVGSTWTYASSVSSGNSYTLTKIVTQSTSSSYEMKFFASNSTVYDLQTIRDDGNGLTMSEDDYYNKADNSLAYTMTYTPSMLIRPPDMTQGASASSTSTRSYLQNGVTSTGTYVRSIIVNGVESVTVPAGTFSAVKITTDVTFTPSAGTPTGSTDIRWYVLDIGWVKRITYLAASPANTKTDELASYSVLP